MTKIKSFQTWKRNKKLVAYILIPSNSYDLWICMLPLNDEAMGDRDLHIQMHSISVASSLPTRCEIPIRRFSQTFKNIYLCAMRITTIVMPKCWTYLHVINPSDNLHLAIFRYSCWVVLPAWHLSDLHELRSFIKEFSITLYYTRPL